MYCFFFIERRNTSLVADRLFLICEQIFMKADVWLACTLQQFRKQFWINKLPHMDVESLLTVFQSESSFHLFRSGQAVPAASIQSLNLLQVRLQMVQLIR